MTAMQTDPLALMTSPLYAEYVLWLNDEAEQLDGYDFAVWLARLHPDLRYRMPGRQEVTRKGSGHGFSTTSFHLDEDLTSMSIRIRRITEATNFAENPPTRTRRFVTNIRLSPESTADEVTGSNYVLLLRSRGIGPELEMLSAERRDRLVRTDSGLQLVEREVLVDQTTLGLVHLGTPL